MPSQVIQIPLTGGLKQSVATEYLDPTQNLVTVANGAYLKDGSVQKRMGAAALVQIPVPGDPSFGTPQRLVTRQSGAELDAINGDSLFAVSTTTGVVANRGLVPPCVATRSHLVGGAQIAANNYTPPFGSFSVAEGSGFRAVAYRTALGSATTGLGITSGTVYLSLYDLNGTIILSALAAAVGNWLAPQVIIIGNYCYLFVGNANTGNIVAVVLNLTTMAFGAPVTVVNDCLYGYENVFAVTPYVGGTTAGILMLYGQADGGGSRPRYLRLEALPALTITAPAGVQGQIGIVTLVACRHDANKGVAWFGWEVDNVAFNDYAACLSVPSWATIAAAFGVVAPASSSFRLGLAPMSATQCCYVTAATSQTITTSGAVTAGTVFSIVGAIDTGDPTIVSAPFCATSGGVTRVYATVSIESGSIPGGQANGSYLLVDLRSFETEVPLRVVATIAPRQGDPDWILLGAGLPDYRMVDVTNVGDPTAGTFRTLAGISGSQEETVNGNEITSFTDLVTFDFTGSVNWQYAEGGVESYLSGGVASYYDGAGVQEMGFFQWPQGPQTVALAGSGGSLNLGGTNLPYTWAVLFACIDNAQQLWRSTYWEVVSAVPATNDSATLIIPPLPFSNRFVGARTPWWELYRNTQAAQTIFYFVTSGPCNPLQLGGGAYPTSVTVVDGTPDTDISTNPLLYTTGGLLDSVNPPSLRCILKHNERLWGIDETGFVVWYTTNFGPSNAPFFNEALTLQFSEGPLTALGELDAYLIAFSATGIWSVAGDGPPVTGQGSSLTTATPVPSPVGCASWTSLISFAQGLMFQAPSGGMYLLDRSLSVTYLKDCQDIINSSVTVVSSELVPGQEVIRFVLSSGTVVTYDWSFSPGRWATASYPANVTSGVVANGSWCFGGADGNIYVEKTAASPFPYMDLLATGIEQWVTDTTTLADVKPGGLQGWSELEYAQWIARTLDPCDVTVSLTYNYGQVTESRTFFYSAIATGSPAAPGIALGRVSPQGSNAQPMAVRLSITTSSPTGGTLRTGQGMRILGAAFKVSPLGPIYDNIGAGVKQ
jgi:hypothetical protein